MVLNVVGSSPTNHPIKRGYPAMDFLFFLLRFLASVMHLGTVRIVISSGVGIQKK